MEPCGFPLTDKALKRAALDYGTLAQVERRDGFKDFLAAPARSEGRLVLVETDAIVTLDRFAFQDGDTLILGRESAGVADEVLEAAQASVRIPMARGARSLNVAVAAAVALAEALRQTGGLRRLEA